MRILRSYEIVITHYSCAIISFFNTGLYKSAFSTYLFGEIVLSSCAFRVFFLCAEFDTIFLNFYNICITIVYIVGVRCFCSHLLEEIVKTDKRHKNLIAALDKEPASLELLSFKISFIKKNMELKVCKGNAINKYFFRENLRSGRFILNI